MAKYKPSDYELLRRRCAELKEAGWKQNKIAVALGLTEGWVSGPPLRPDSNEV